MDYRELMISNPVIFTNKNALFKIVTDEGIIKEWISIKKVELASKKLPQEWGDIGIVYEDPYIIILRDLLEYPDGHLHSYFRILKSADLRRGQSIVVLPVINSKILLMRQFRHPTRQWHWEIPRGFGEPDISPEDNAKKELLEEIGGEISELINLGIYHSDTGLMGDNVQLFLAHLNSVGDVCIDEGIVSYKLIDIREIEKMIRDSEITDGYTIAAYTRAKLRGML